MTNTWLMKSEPDCFSIDDLASRPNQTEAWDGVRNYQARNMMRDQMRLGDRVFFYHSNCKVPGIAGIAEISKVSFADHTQFEPDSQYFDPKATLAKPIWYLVEVQFVEKFNAVLSLEQMRHTPGLEDMLLLRKGSRLSITPVTNEQGQIIMSLAL